jgi:serine/threonine-protein kinase
VVGGGAAGAAAGAAAASAADADGPQSQLARANALAAERNWVPEDTTYDDEPADEPERKGRSPWTWPLIALILLLLFALVGFFLNQQGILFPSNSATSSAPSSSATSASPTRTSQSATPTPTRNTPTPTQETVNIIPAAYLGKDYRQVQSELSNLGLAVTVEPLQTSEASPGQVVGLNPTGPLPVGSPITVTYAVAPPAPTTQAPTSAAPTTTAPSTAQSAPSPQLTLPACADGEQPGTPATCTP